jgi:hypothetical protein
VEGGRDTLYIVSAHHNTTNSYRCSDCFVIFKRTRETNYQTINTQHIKSHQLHCKSITMSGLAAAAAAAAAHTHGADLPAHLPPDTYTYIGRNLTPVSSCEDPSMINTLPLASNTSSAFRMTRGSMLAKALST